MFFEQLLDKSENLFNSPPWKVLIVDDEPDVHLVTEIVLKDFEYLNRNIEFLHAYNSNEAKNILTKTDDLAVAFVDVVMEQDDAGLRLVEWIRSKLGNKRLRIVLRTGQPGMAPEDKVIVDYQINDYKSKSELSSQKLKTTLVSALRGFCDITKLEQSQSGLEMMLDASRYSNFEKFAHLFAKGFIVQMTSIFDQDEELKGCVKGIVVYSNLDGFIIDGKGLYQGREGDSLSESEFDSFFAKANDYNLYAESFDDFNNEIFLKLAHPEYSITIAILLNDTVALSRRIAIHELFNKALCRMQHRFPMSGEEGEMASHTNHDGINDLQFMEEGAIERIEPIFIKLIRNLKRQGHFLDVLTDDFIDLASLHLMTFDFESAFVRSNLQNTDFELVTDQSSFENEVEGMLLSNHLRWDGEGNQPDIKKEQIPLLVRVLSVIYIYDKLLNGKGYKSFFNKKSSLEFLSSRSGIWFDPVVTDVFIEIIGGDEKNNFV